MQLSLITMNAPQRLHHLSKPTTTSPIHQCFPHWEAEEGHFRRGSGWGGRSAHEGIPPLSGNPRYVLCGSPSLPSLYQITPLSSPTPPYPNSTHNTINDLLGGCRSHYHKYPNYRPTFWESWDMAHSTYDITGEVPGLHITRVLMLVTKGG
jgi:hypothetical protein